MYDKNCFDWSARRMEVIDLWKRHLDGWIYL